MLSQTVEYALRAAVYLAGQAPEPRTTRQIARATRVPSAYLSKVLQGLARAGIVQSQRGVGGGVRLAVDAEELTILRVVQAVDPIRRIDYCPLKLAAHGSRLCPLHSRLDQALASIEQAFGQTTLAVLLREPTESIPLCPFPQPQAASRSRPG